MSVAETIRPKDRDAILAALRAGVVPRRGFQHIQIGRLREIEALMADCDRIAEGGSVFRLVIGEFGSGKTFFLYLVGAIARKKKLVTVGADLNPDRRLHGSGGQARSLYAELMRNLATQAKEDGGALPSVVERFVSDALQQARKEGRGPDVIIHERLEHLSELVGGYDFANVVAAYWRGFDTGDEALKSAALRWLRGEFSTKTEARQALGVRNIVDDASVYDHLKLFARFVRLAGYGGLLVCVDEMVNLYKMANKRARDTNYEQLLRILNDGLQGTAEGLGFLGGGTPEFLTDGLRGLYGYAALRTRLEENRFLRDGVVDVSGPVLRLGNLSQEDFGALLTKLRHVHAGGDPAKYLVDDNGLVAFMRHCHDRIGDAYFRTPRQTIRTFVQLLDALEQDPQTSLGELLGGVTIAAEENPDLAPLDDDEAGSTGDDLADFKL